MKRFSILVLLLSVFVLCLLPSCKATPEIPVEEQVVGWWETEVGAYDYLLHIRADKWAVFFKVHNDEVYEIGVYQWFIENNLFVMVDEQRYPDIAEFSLSGDTLVLGTLIYARVY